MDTSSTNSEQTTSNLKAPKHVLIINPIHPLYGHSVPVIRSIVSGGNVKVIVQHPNGGTMYLPQPDVSSEGDLNKLPAMHPSPLFTPSKLLSLSKRISVILTDSN